MDSDHRQDLSIARPGHPRTDRGSGIGSILATLFLTPLIAIILSAFVFQAYQVSGQSMEPTLHNNDRLIIWKLPRTWSRITNNSYVPARGDVVVVQTSKLAKAGLDPHEQIIKRVIGLPGERVVVKDNKLTVYNGQYPDGFQPERTLPYGDAIKGTNTDGEWTLGANQLFICGDNRYNSADSRLFGPIDTKDVIGKLAVRMLPLSDFKPF